MKLLRFVFARKIDLPRDWELHLEGPCSDGKYRPLSHNGSFFYLCKRGKEMDIVRAMVERTQVDLETRQGNWNTPLQIAAKRGHRPVVQYLCEQGG